MQDIIEDEIMTFRFRGMVVSQCRRSNYNIIGVLLPDLASVVDDAKVIFTDGDTPDAVEFKVKTIRMAYEYARCGIANKMAEGTSFYDIISDFPNMEELEEQGWSADMLVPFRMFLWHIKANFAHNVFALLIGKKQTDKAMEIRELILKEFITNIETLPEGIRNEIAEGLENTDDGGNEQVREAIDLAQKALKKKARKSKKSDKNISKENTEGDEKK